MTAITCGFSCADTILWLDPGSSVWTTKRHTTCMSKQMALLHRCKAITLFHLCKHGNQVAITGICHLSSWRCGFEEKVPQENYQWENSGFFTLTSFLFALFFMNIVNHCPYAMSIATAHLDPLQFAYNVNRSLNGAATGPVRKCIPEPYM